MENSPYSKSRPFAPTALMFGNLVTGCSVLAPAGMLSELSKGFDITISTAGLLITFGAVMLCIASPATAWLTSRIERRKLLVAALAVLALGNLASSVAPNYASLLVIRVLMLSVGALYTPQAAGTAALLVAPERRGGTIAYIFLGWSLSAAVGLPLITFIASSSGWQVAYATVGAVGVLSACFLVWRLPGGLTGAPVEVKTWVALGRNRDVVLLLAITTLQMSGQFVVFTFMGPLLKNLTDAGPDRIGIVFALYGAFGFIGNVLASRVVDSWGAYRTSILFTSLLLAGVAGWAIGAGAYSLMAGAVGVWGLGFASTNSMQQVRLVAAAPPLAPASVSLNTSVLYIGQATGSAIGGLLYGHELFHSMGFAAAAFVTLALAMVIVSRPSRSSVGS